MQCFSSLFRLEREKRRRAEEKLVRVADRRIAHAWTPFYYKAWIMMAGLTGFMFYELFPFKGVPLFLYFGLKALFFGVSAFAALMVGCRLFAKWTNWRMYG